MSPVNSIFSVTSTVFFCCPPPPLRTRYPGIEYVTAEGDEPCRLQMSQGDTVSGRIARGEVAEAVVAALGSPYSGGKTFELRRDEVILGSFSGVVERGRVSSYRMTLSCTLYCQRLIDARIRSPRVCASAVPPPCDKFILQARCWLVGWFVGSLDG